MWQIGDDGRAVWLTADGDGVELEEVYDPRTPPELRIPATRDLHRLIRAAKSPSHLLDLSTRLAMFAEEAAETGTVEDHSVLADTLWGAVRAMEAS